MSLLEELEAAHLEGRKLLARTTDRKLRRRLKFRLRQLRRAIKEVRRET